MSAYDEYRKRRADEREAAAAAMNNIDGVTWRLEQAAAWVKDSSAPAPFLTLTEAKRFTILVERGYDDGAVVFTLRDAQVLIATLADCPTFTSARACAVAMSIL